MVNRGEEKVFFFFAPFHLIPFKHTLWSMLSKSTTGTTHLLSTRTGIMNLVSRSIVCLVWSSVARGKADVYTSEVFFFILSYLADFWTVHCN